MSGSKWYQYESSDSEKIFWRYFSPLEVPIILVWCIPVAIFLRWLINDGLGREVPDFQGTSIFFAIVTHLLLSATSYGLLRSLLRMLMQRSSKAGMSVSTAEQSAPIVATPVARVVSPGGNPSALYPCPDCGHSVSRRADRCPACGCPNNSKA